MTTQELNNLIDKCVSIGKFINEIEDNYSFCMIRANYIEKNSSLIIRYNSKQMVRPIAELLGGTIDDIYSSHGLVHNGIHWNAEYIHKSVAPLDEDAIIKLEKAYKEIEELAIANEADITISPNAVIMTLKQTNKELHELLSDIEYEDEKVYIYIKYSNFDVAIFGKLR